MNPDHRNASSRHAGAARALDKALAHLRVALSEEGDLEWAGQISCLIADAEHIRQRLVVYAEVAAKGE